MISCFSPVESTLPAPGLGMKVPVPLPAHTDAPPSPRGPAARSSAPGKISCARSALLINSLLGAALPSDSLTRLHTCRIAQENAVSFLTAFLQSSSTEASRPGWSVNGVLSLPGGIRDYCAHPGYLICFAADGSLPTCGKLALKKKPKGIKMNVSSW